MDLAGGRRGRRRARGSGIRAVSRGRSGHRPRSNRAARRGRRGGPGRDRRRARRARCHRCRAAGRPLRRRAGWGFSCSAGSVAPARVAPRHAVAPGLQSRRTRSLSAIPRRPRHRRIRKYRSREPKPGAVDAQPTRASSSRSRAPVIGPRTGGPSTGATSHVSPNGCSVSPPCPLRKRLQHRRPISRCPWHRAYTSGSRTAQTGAVQRSGVHLKVDTAREAEPRVGAAPSTVDAQQTMDAWLPPDRATPRAGGCAAARRRMGSRRSRHVHHTPVRAAGQGGVRMVLGGLPTDASRTASRSAGRCTRCAGVHTRSRGRVPHRRQSPGARGRVGERADGHAARRRDGRARRRRVVLRRVRLSADGDRRGPAVAGGAAVRPHGARR